MLLIPGDPEGAAAVTTVMAAVVVGCVGDLGRAVGLPDRLAAVVAIVAGALGGLGAGLFTAVDVGWWVLLLAGGLAGGASHGLRHAQSVLPTLERELGPGIAAALARTASMARADSEALDDLAEGRFAGVAVLTASR